jgi:hypothetical protein
MELQDFIEFDELYFKKYPSWGEAPAAVWALDEGHAFEVKAEHNSPYELMNEFAVYSVTGKAILAIRGWGAPINPDEDVEKHIRPSLHPNRMRLALYMYFDEDSEKLEVAMHQEGEDLMVMGDSGVGGLADAAYAAIANVTTIVNNIKEEASK